MATYLAQMKRRNGGVWDELFPYTTVDQITDATAIGKNLLKNITTPGANSLIQLTSGSNVVTVKQLSTFISENNLSPAVHTHAVSDITSLVSTLAAKASLGVDGKILASQLPSWLLGGTKMVLTRNTNLDLGDSTKFNAFLTSMGISGTGNEFKGRYMLCTADITVTIFTSSAPYTINFEEGASGTTLLLEDRDWLVYRGYEGGKYVFDVVNNTYQKATTGQYGVVKLSSSIARSTLISSGVGEDNAVTEKTLKSIMRVIHRVDNDTALNALTDVQEGDIAFVGVAS